MRKRQLLLAILASATLTTTACLSPTKPLPKDGPDLVEQAVAEAKAKWCEGQHPSEFTKENFDAAPQWVRDYISGNNAQYLAAGCKV